VIRSRRTGQVQAILPAKRLRTPAEAKDYYLRGAVVGERDVLVFPLVRP